MDLRRLYTAVVFLAKLINDWGLDPKHLWSLVSAIVEADDPAARQRAIKDLTAFFLEFFATRLRGEGGAGIGMLEATGSSPLDMEQLIASADASPPEPLKTAYDAEVSKIAAAVVVPEGLGIGSGAIARMIARVAAPLALSLFETFAKRLIGELEG
jgi:hypothetical protein